jgi:hypothetical protein
LARALVGHERKDVLGWDSFIPLFYYQSSAVTISIFNAAIAAVA